jgi:hypothetical protein
MLLVTSNFLLCALPKQDYVVRLDISTKTLIPEPRSLTPCKNLKSEIRKLKSTQKPTTDTDLKSEIRKLKSTQKPTTDTDLKSEIYSKTGSRQRI